MSLQVVGAVVASLVGGLAGYAAWASTSHERLSRAVGFEGVGVVPFCNLTTATGKVRAIVAYSGERLDKKTNTMKTVLSVPGGKVESVDVIMAIKREPIFFIMHPAIAIALETAVREMREETGVDVPPKKLFFDAFIGHGHTDTKQPVAVFSWEAPIDPADSAWKDAMLKPNNAKKKDGKDEFTGVVIVPTPMNKKEQKEFRGFNQHVLAALKLVAEEEKAKE